MSEAGPERDQPPSETPPSDAPHPSAPDTANSESPAEAGLPEWEPLTPELVEDEAIRGDFMLRCAVVLLALLFGCRQLADSSVLVRVKTGQYLAAHGFWPPSNDVFSCSATDHRWINLAWLWDLLAAGLFAVGEGVGLSLATAALAAATWWLLSKHQHDNVSTWWSSILAALALLACHPIFSGQPDLLTLLCLTALLWVLRSWREQRGARLWWLIPGFVVWSNLDSRMVLGMAALLFWGLGDLLGERMSRPAMSGSQRSQFWRVCGACVVASCWNPSGWRGLAAPVTWYRTEYPAWRFHAGSNAGWEDLQPFSLFSSLAWETWRLPIVSSVIVLLSAATSLVLNRKRLNFADALLFAGMSALGLIAIHELPAATLVACVLGGVHAQQWYQANFRQTYSIETRELLFTRGGRAVTVFAFFVLAVLAVNQRLFGSGGQRLGFGLSAELRSLIDGYRAATENPFDDRPFNFVPRQGDVLIWLGQKPFVDSRLAVFSGSAERDVLALHDRVRRSLAQLPTEGDARGETGIAPPPDESWKPVFDRLQITHVVPRMIGVRPVTYFKLLTTPGWVLTHVGPVCAVLYRADTPDAARETYLAEHRLSFTKWAFQTDSREPDPRSDWPRRRTTYQKYVAPAPHRVSNFLREADNLLLHVQALASTRAADPGSVAAWNHLAIRKANAALGDAPDQAAAFQILGDAYSYLSNLESSLFPPQSGFMNELRFKQALAAYQQSLILEPDVISVHLRLLELLQRFNRPDLALRELQELQRLGERMNQDDPEVQQMRQRHAQLREQLQNQLDQLRERIDAALDQGQDPLEIAAQAYQAGYVLEALRLLDRDPAATRDSPHALSLRGLLLFESGRTEESFDLFDFFSEPSPAPWRVSAAFACLAHGDYGRSLQHWSRETAIGEQSTLSGLLGTLPISGPPNLWPIQHVLVGSRAIEVWPEQQAQLLWYKANAELEMGKPHSAGKTLSGLLEVAPNSALRPLARFYLYLITDELIDAEPPAEWIPIQADMFAPDEP